MTPAELDRLTYHLKTIARKGDTEWSRKFARSILGRAKRPGWQPSPKQAAVMRRMVSEMFDQTTAGGDDLVLIEGVDDAV